MRLLRDRSRRDATAAAEDAVFSEQHCDDVEGSGQSRTAFTGIDRRRVLGITPGGPRLSVSSLFFMSFFLPFLFIASKSSYNPATTFWRIAVSFFSLVKIHVLHCALCR